MSQKILEMSSRCYLFKQETESVKVLEVVSEQRNSSQGDLSRKITPKVPDVSHDRVSGRERYQER